MMPPDLEIEPDWEPFHLPFDIGSGRSMFVETESGPTIRMRFFKRRPDNALVGRVWFGEATFGPPGFAHGGVVAFVLDEAMGSAAWLAGYPCIAANLNIDFMEMTPLGRYCFIEANVDEVRPTKLAVAVKLSLDGKLLVRGRGVFPRLNKQRMLEMSRTLGQPLPDLSGYDFAKD
jgi:acyl-coenzyme A thioesterase PaaI-like protein